ncbi:acyl-CoA dehydrogenase family protein [Methylobacter sp. S3L5C]|uniref:acyl-CoA dehydrogenase family protein n=1 Tax=Methylobacter sp. S3L5C TaxID=2839024 RepID=UPI001FABD082|nr:acyl-CoA dehydrogenase family protein [Methylobacter sp. S3L5C]UOA08144.1 acyl-CoA dehydrogenase family protein [Methylobacter sp. S3L5C]
MKAVNLDEPSSPRFVGQIHEVAEELSQYFYETAAERDAEGGTPLEQRQAIRESGLLKLSIPEEFGGLGANWSTIYKTVRTIAKTDSSLAQVFAFQFLMLASIRLYGTTDQWQKLFKETAEKNLWWGNALNPLDTRTIATHQDNHLFFNGQKSFCSGATDSDRLIISAIEEGTKKFIVAAIPTQRSGIHLNNDWNNMGQRQTDSGSVEFTALRVEEHELLINPGPLSSPFSSLRSLIAQLIFTNIYLGITEGALSEAVKYTQKNSRVWSGSLAKNIQEDPYTLLHYGEFWASLEASRVLADHAARLLDNAWEKGLSLTAEERGEVALAIFAAKVNITKTGLDVTSRIFEVAGARSTTFTLKLDRFWRNLRVYTLHDPLDYKLNELGDWALNGNYPSHSFYS